MTPTIVKMPEAPAFCEKEALRYAGCRTYDASVAAMLQECLHDCQSALTYRVCYRELPFSAESNLCDFGIFQVRSTQLSRNLNGCRHVLLFAATIGIGIDRQITRYSKIQPSRAVLLQALGTERIEALCDLFCRQYADEHAVRLRPRFSPGYGDLPLEIQKDIFSTLDCQKNIGVFLNDSLLASPTKSVTAFVGITETEAAPLSSASLWNTGDPL